MCKLTVLQIFGLILVSNELTQYTAVQVKRTCPKTTQGLPNIAVRSEAPGHAVAKCKNGIVALSSSDNVIHSITGQFDQTYKGSDCVFYKQESGTYSLDLEVWWGSGDDQILMENRTVSVSCEYNLRGNLLQPDDEEEWSLSPMLLTPEKPDAALLTLNLVDDMGKKLTTKELTIGQRIQLVAEDQSGLVPSFRADSCQATDGDQIYFILQSGCGDGYIFNKSSGFKTQGNKVFSPFFSSFQLRGSRKLEIRCTFIICSANCDGHSCDKQKRRGRRSIMDIISSSFVSVTSGPVFLSPLR